MIQTLQWIYFLALPVIIGSWLERCHNASTQPAADVKDPNCDYGKEKPDPDWVAWLKPATDLYGPEQSAAVSARAQGAPSPVTEDMKHTRSCAALGGYESDCTCCLEERKALATEQTMHRAWRKRAEEAEAALATFTSTPSESAQGAPIPSEAELVKNEIARAQEQDAAISASEVEFMDELRRRRAQGAPTLEQIKNGIDTRLNDWLCEMKPNYDDSITGFNEAWDIVRKYLNDKISALTSTERGAK